MAIDDEIDQAKLQIEYGKKSVAPKVVTALLEACTAIGLPTKLSTFVMKKVSDRKEDNVEYLLEAVIARLRTNEADLKSLSEEHKKFVEKEFPRLMLEAVDRAQQASSTEKIDRLSLIVVHTVLVGPEVNLVEVDEALRITIDLNENDIEILAMIYSVHAKQVWRRGFLPDLNIANNTWKDLQTDYPVFKSSEIYSICSKLQSFGLITQVERVKTVLDLNSTPYSILRKGADYLEAIGKARNTPDR
jgi:hypothetical protein